MGHLIHFSLIGCVADAFRTLALSNVWRTLGSLYIYLAAMKRVFAFLAAKTRDTVCTNRNSFACHKAKDKKEIGTYLSSGVFCGHHSISTFGQENDRRHRRPNGYAGPSSQELSRTSGGLCAPVSKFVPINSRGWREHVITRLPASPNL